MKRFLRKIFGVDEPRPGRGDTRVTYWREPATRTWNWHCQDGNNEVVCQGTQGYENRGECLAGIANARNALDTAVFVERKRPD